MFDQLLSYLAPHRCYRCQKLGSLLCKKCENYISKQAYVRCILCAQPTRHGNLCQRHHQPYQQAWCVGQREGVLRRLIDDLKFHRVQAAAEVLAGLLDQVLPVLPPDTVFVPLPTTPRNIRRRGYDHMERIVRRLARRRRQPLQRLLVRRSNLTQHFAPSAVVRRQQAKQFFALRQTPRSDVTYVLVDDIFTTGSTIQAAAALLRQAGAATVYVAVVVRHVDTSG